MVRIRMAWAGSLCAAVTLVLSGCASDIRNGPVSSLADARELKQISAAFDPGLIVSDQQFYDATSLSVEGIQSFLEAVPCTPGPDAPCLSTFRATLTAIPAETQEPGHCEAIAPTARARASDIIAAVAVACGVSPKMLLVLMQKEQSLLTKPTAYGYERATGYGCPDTADCNTKYFGLVNQLYNAAWQFRQYTQQPDRTYRIGNVDVAYNPDPDCGAEPVDIRNQATANLYNYTPYQPNAAAIADPAGEGDDCSAWGNLNVWLLWNVWFGDPSAEPVPAYLGSCFTHDHGGRCRPFDPESFILPTPEEHP